jgi:hypothetical protein
MIDDAQEIAEGKKPNRTEASVKDPIMLAGQAREELARLVDMGKLVADPVYVKVVEWKEAEKRLDKLWLYNHDMVPYFTGKRMDTLGEFFNVHLQTRNIPPIYRVMLPHPILSSGGGTRDQSFTALEQGDTAYLLKRFIVWAGFVKRFSKKQREEHKAKTGKELMDQYWEVVGRTVSVRVAGRPVKFDLFLPSGMDYAILPLIQDGKPIEFTKGTADPAVQAAGYRIFCGDYLGA